MHVRRLRPIAREEEEPIRTALEDCRAHNGPILPVLARPFQLRLSLRAIHALIGHRRGELAPAAGYFAAGPPGVGTVVCGSGREGSSPDVLVRGFQPSRNTVTSTALRPKASAS